MGRKVMEIKMDPFSKFWIAAYVVNFAVLVVIVCFERRDPVVSLAWVLGFTVIPVVGFVVFLIFGQGLKKKTAKKYAAKWRMNIDLSEKIQKEREIDTLRQNKDYRHSQLMLYLLNTNNSVYTEGNDVKIYTDAKEKYMDLIHDIRQAKESIHLLYFIIRDDQISRKILKELSQKAREGVEVRFLYDDFGSLLTPRHIFKELKQSGGKVSAFFPVTLGSYSKINHRNHRKIVVVDGKIGYLGGINIGDEYMSLKKLRPWRDTHLRITGGAVKFLQKAFALDWVFSTDEDLSVNIKKYFPFCDTAEGETGIQIVASGPDSAEEEVKCAMISMINSAKDHVYIQTPYFVPDKSFINAIKMASQSGVDVRVMIPGKPDKSYVYYTTYSYMGELLDAGIKVYIYDGFIHAKTLVCDGDISTIGTTNIDIRSFQLHFEINAVMYGEKTAAECNRIFIRDIKHCTQLSSEDYGKRGVWQQMKEGFFRLFSPIL